MPNQHGALAETLVAGLNKLPGKEADPEQVRQLLSYLELLVQWNASYSLTAVRDPLEMVSRHLLDSLSVLPWVHGEHLLDAGTGAGLPGIPLAIMQPELTVTLLDSHGQKNPLSGPRQASLEPGEYSACAGATRVVAS